MTLRPATLSGTILYAGEATIDGHNVHVLGYQNCARSSGPNAMILPIPSKVGMSPENVVSTKDAKTLLTKYKETLEEPSYDDDYLGDVRINSRGLSRGVQVFESGNYTVLLADRPSEIPSVLGRVPVHKRPTFDSALFDAYEKWYPGWHVAVCCFNGKVEPTPMLWWYEPLDEARLFAPALDGHGTVPNLNADVAVDHAVVFASDKTSLPDYGKDLLRDIPADVAQYMSNAYLGRIYEGRLPNGDFYMNVEKLRSLSLGAAPQDNAHHIERRMPPGA